VLKIIKNYFIIVFFFPPPHSMGLVYKKMNDCLICEHEIVESLVKENNKNYSTILKIDILIFFNFIKMQWMPFSS
jgi:hypothetical protein